MLILGGFTFFILGFADNLTATLVALAIMLKVMSESSIKLIVKTSVFVLFAANAGGLLLITGDVTTLIIFVAGKVNMLELLKLYMPAILSMSILYILFIKGMGKSITLVKDNTNFDPLDTKIAVIFTLTIFAILFGHVAFHFPPVLTFLTGLSLMFLIIAHNKVKTKPEIDALEYIRRIEFDALFSFLGVLLLVGALKEVGILVQLAGLYDFVPTYIATFFIGLLSAIVDNIPITAVILKAELPLDHDGWMFMAYAVGVGGSLLAIGSAVGVVAMSKVKELTFVVYLIGYMSIFIIVWLNLKDLSFERSFLKKINYIK